VCRVVTDWERVVEFHGHVCPGLAIGYRAAKLALERFLEKGGNLDDLYVITENDACGVDAIQVLTGCTFGKGRLIYKDTGKMAYTFGSISWGKGERLVVRGEFWQRSSDQEELFNKILEKKATEEERKRFSELQNKRAEEILTMPTDQLFKIQEVPFKIRPVKIFKSLTCSKCGESVMEPKARLYHGEIVCKDCFIDYKVCE